MFDFLQKFKKGNLTEGDVIEEMITHLGGSLHSYMVMLEAAERTAEASRIVDIRERIFNIRSKVAGGNFMSAKAKAIDPVDEMQKVSIELKTMGDMIGIYRPNEGIVFQSPVNNAIGLVWVIKEYMGKQVS